MPGRFRPISIAAMMHFIPSKTTTQGKDNAVVNVNKATKLIEACIPRWSIRCVSLDVSRWYANDPTPNRTKDRPARSPTTLKTLPSVIVYTM